jgi:hypothetical protein
MPPSYAALYQAALDRRHRDFASPKGRRYHVPLARNRATWHVRCWLKLCRKGQQTPEVVEAIADCMATITVLSSRS